MLTICVYMLEGSMIGTVDIFACFLSSFGKEASTSCTDKLGQAAGGFADCISESGSLLGC